MTDSTVNEHEMSDTLIDALIVDGDEMREAPLRLTGRGPERHEQIDYGRLRFYAKWEAFGARGRVRPIFVQRELRGAGRFYAYLEREGYELRLRSQGTGSEWEPADALMEALGDLGEGAGNVVFAGGNGYRGGITRMLHELATTGERDVAVAYYDGWRTIDCGHVRYRGLAADIGAMPSPATVPRAVA